MNLVLQETSPGLNYVSRLDEPAAADRMLVGGKAIGLVELTRHGFRVPGSLIVTTRAFDAFLAETWPDGNYPADPKVVSNALMTIRFGRQSQVLEDLTHELTYSLANLGYVSEPFEPGLAVRSSATVEDSASRSFAGAFHSSLSVRSLRTTVAAIRRCWVSLWEAGGVDRRGQAKMGVIVQRMIDAEVAGVAFSHVPSRPECTLVEASWGLGKSVVDGAIQPDSIEYNNRSGELEYAVGSKRAAFQSSSLNGVVKMELSQNMRDARCLSDKVAIEIATVVRRAAGDLGYPLDIEWALKGGEMYLLQARPLVSRRFIAK